NPSSSPATRIFNTYPYPLITLKNVNLRLVVPYDLVVIFSLLILLPLPRVLGFDRGLFGFPPIAVLSVPVARVLQASLKISKFRFPAQFVPQLGGVDRVTQVVARPVLDLVVGVSRLAHHLQDQLEDILVVLFA